MATGVGEKVNSDPINQSVFTGTAGMKKLKIVKN